MDVKRNARQEPIIKKGTGKKARERKKKSGGRGEVCDFFYLPGTKALMALNAISAISLKNALPPSFLLF
jgi:hypothetical protein